MVHHQDVPGTDVMKVRAEVITYRMREVPRGAQLRLITHGRAAREAIHRFLLSQRTDHHADQ